MVGGSGYGAAVLLTHHHGPSIFVGVVGEHQGAALHIQGSGQVSLGGGLHVGFYTGGAVLHNGLGVVVAHKQVEQAGKGRHVRLGTGLDEADGAEPVYDDGGGDGVHVESVGQARSILSYGEGHTLLGGIGCQYVVGILGLAGNGDDLHPILVLLIGLFQEGELRSAGAAPGSPDVDEHHVLFLENLRQGHGLTVKGGNGEVPHGIAHLIGGGVVLGGSGGLLRGGGGCGGGRLGGGLLVRGVFAAGAQEQCRHQQQAK